MTTKGIILVPPKQLRQQCDPKQFTFKSTDELKPLDQLIGQPRAYESLEFGIRIQSHGYNLFAIGPAGTGKFSFINQLVKERAEERPPPNDWCYLYNFSNPLRPIAVSLKPGDGKRFKKDMHKLVEELQSLIPSLLESDEFRGQIQEIEDEFKAKEEEAFKKLEKEARKEDLLLLSTPHGFTVAPAKDGEVISLKEFESLPEKERKRKEEKVVAIRQKIRKFLEKLPALSKKKQKAQRKLQRDYVVFAIGKSIHRLKKKYKKYDVLINYLNEVENDILENLQEFISKEPATPTKQPSAPELSSIGLLKYEVNLLVSHSTKDHAPVIYEDHPIHRNLIGCFEHVAQMGALVTNFTLIKAGALHRANGGYLILEIEKLLSEPFAWDSIKRALFSKTIKIEPLSHELTFMSTVSIMPEPISLDVKVILIGPRSLYYTLCELDSDFQKLFKVVVDFNEDTDRTAKMNQLFARLIAGISRKENLKAFTPKAVANVIDQCSRYVDDAQKLSMHMASIADLIREANYWATQSKQKYVKGKDVEKAIKEQIKRLNRVREYAYEDIKRKDIFIDTKGKKAGQVNALSVVEMAEFYFGQPSRITAVTRLGKGDIVDIEREVDLGGSLHSKGVLILSGFFQSRYARNHHLSLSASIVFEQNYGHVDGDSASAAELVALLSSLSNTPIKQNFGITGSINQLGEIQPIGAVNAKIEGFFEICSQNQLTGDQGVVIPKPNIKNLMLKKDVVRAVEKGLFHIYAVSNIDEAVEVMTGKSAGKRDRKGNFPKDSVNYLVEKRLLEYVEIAKEEKD